MFLQLLPAVVSIGVFCVYCVLESLRGFLKLPIYCVRLKSWELLDALRLPSHVVATLLPWALPSSPSWDCLCMWSRPTVTCNNVAGYKLLHVGCPACRVHYAEQQSMQHHASSSKDCTQGRASKHVAISPHYAEQVEHVAQCSTMPPPTASAITNRRQLRSGNLGHENKRVRRGKDDPRETQKSFPQSSCPSSG